MSLEHMLEDERESWRLLLEEAEREGEFIMNIGRLQDEARRMYDIRPAEEAAGWAQAIAQCEIAENLSQIAVSLDYLAGRAATIEQAQEKQNELLLRIAVGIEGLEVAK